MTSQRHGHHVNDTIKKNRKAWKTRTVRTPSALVISDDENYWKLQVWTDFDAEKSIRMKNDYVVFSLNDHKYLIKHLQA